ncbi:MAG: energy transducer TonB [Pseudomonadaceae bacterium]|nr:energy transducer TonB [Pseudomonadaceae bacterium]
MIDELRRRAYLSAMQVVSWLPRQVLPFAAPARPEWLPPAPAEQEPEPQVRPAAAQPIAAPAAPVEAPRPRVEVPRPQATPRAASVAEAAPTEAAEPVAKALPPPRFTLQLLRAGSCALLVELPTGEAFTRRDPAYLLLKDLLRAAGLPDAPQVIGEPVRWPLLARGSLDQGPHAALEYVQSFVAAQLEQQERCACLWLLGLPAVRYAGEADEAAYNRELQIDGLGAAWALPGLELLMDEPQRKAELWQSMRRLMPRWQTAAVENH